MKKSLHILLCVTSVALVACNNNESAHTIELNKNTLELKVNESATLTAVIQPNDVENPQLIWTIDNDSIATINQGIVNALSKGTTNINVYFDLNENSVFDIGEPTDTCILTVVDDNDSEIIPVESITLDQLDLDLFPEDESILNATVLPNNASEKTITWLSSDITIVTVTNGRVVAITPGNATITAYVDENRNAVLDQNEKSATCSVTVVPPIVDTKVWVTSVTLSESTITLEEGDIYTTVATVAPSNATYQTVTWFSANATIATATNGRIEAISNGTTVVYAYVDENNNKSLDDVEKRATLSITVKDVIITPDPKDPIPASGESLPIGNKTVSGPNNTTPVDITDWVNYDFSSSLPQYWSHILGNNKKTTSFDFYAASSGGGFKFSQVYYGLQSPLLNSWLKTEVRLTVSQVNGNSQSQSQYEGKPIFHIYSYDNTGHYLGMQTYNQQSKFADVKEIKFYIANPEMAYFEIRLNAFPYKGSQCYNFGVSQISIKGWPYGL